jgi:hypothetical protein
MSVTTVTAVTTNPQHPLGSDHRHGRRRACPDHRSRTPFHKVVTEVTAVTIAEASRTAPY